MGVARDQPPRERPAAPVGGAAAAPADARADATRARAGSYVVVGGLAVVAAGLPTAFGAVAADWGTRAAIAVAAVAALAAVATVLVAAAARPARSELRADARSVLVLTAALASAGAAAIHYAVIWDHFDEYWLFGAFFVACGLAQLAWAVAVVAAPSRLVLAVGLVGNAAVIAAWIYSRTAGLPIGPEPGEPETIGFADVASSALEAVIVLAVAALLAMRPQAAPARADRRTLALAVGVAVVTALGLLSAAGVAAGVIPASA